MLNRRRTFEFAKPRCRHAVAGCNGSSVPRPRANGFVWGYPWRTDQGCNGQVAESGELDDLACKDLLGDGDCASTPTS